MWIINIENRFPKNQNNTFLYEILEETNAIENDSNLGDVLTNQGEFDETKRRVKNKKLPIQ
ncbi:hypothetical protein H1P_760023 [Hyella patelloides LEGE 07179]|uniref:Uncharacterized protein n=1 Tax=Hyella patelloides LEGE 07179 TaxID=945734 RepID=A0A563W3Y2_9CYAN|nr:hypothetical protein H1P_760023 [Hyella patelloides LEGE 07179]